jgi:hypothetical protein
MDDSSRRRGKWGWFSSFAEDSRLLIIRARHPSLFLSLITD